MLVVGDVLVEGVGLDPQTRCDHYQGPTDIVAIKFACCGRWFSCFKCHAAVADHDAEVWPREEYSELAIVCGACGRELSVDEYLGCEFSCPNCTARFNPGCASHYHLYFEAAS